MSFGLYRFVRLGKYKSSGGRLCPKHQAALLKVFKKEVRDQFFAPIVKTNIRFYGRGLK